MRPETSLPERPDPAPAARPFARRAVLAGAVDLASPEQVLSHLAACVEGRRGCFVAGISGPYLAAMGDPGAEAHALREAFLAADLLVPDGQGFVWAARMLGVPCPARLAIPDLCERLCALAAARGWPVFLYGATGDVNQIARKNLVRRHPGLKFAGAHGYCQGPAEEDALIARLTCEGVRVLFVARPSPDKERFLKRACAAAGVVGVAAGGWADVAAGVTRRAPRLLQRMGLEWLWRTAQEPRRLGRRVAWNNLRFAGQVLWAHLRLPAARPWWRCPVIHVALVLLALTASYSAAIGAPWQFDDEEYLPKNPCIRSWAGLGEIQTLAQRKLFWLSNWCCYALSARCSAVHAPEDPDVRIFRAWNIACHLGAALGLYALLRRLTAARAKAAPSTAPAHGSLVPAVAAALFAAHPLATEAVTYVAGRGNSMGGMFYLWGLYGAALFFERGHEKAGCSGWYLALASLACGTAAVLCKESYLTFPAAVALLYAVSYRGTTLPVSWRTLAAVALAGALAVAWIFPYSYERAWTALSGTRGEVPLRALATQAHAVPVMLLKTLAPLGLTVDHDFPTLLSFGAARAQQGLGILLVLAAAGACLAWRGRLAGFAVCLALLSIVPTNSIIERGDVVSERNFYLAAACGALLLAVTAAWIADRAARAAGGEAPALWGGVLGGVALALFAALTFRRNAEYADELTLWRAALREAPAKIRVLHNYGLAAAHKKLYEDADEAFQRAIEAGEAKAVQGRFRPDEAVDMQTWHLSYADLAGLQFRRYLKDPGGTGFSLGRIEALFKRGLAQSDSNPDVALAYARFVAQSGRYGLAADVLEEALRKHPDAGHLLPLLGQAEYQLGKPESARDRFRRALEFRVPHAIAPPQPLPARTRAELLVRLGLAETALGQREKAQRRVREGLAISGEAAFAVLRGPPRPTDAELACFADALGPEPELLYEREMLGAIRKEQGRRKAEKPNKE